MNYGKYLLFTVITIFGHTQIKSVDYTLENTALLKANAKYLTNTQEQALKRFSALKLTHPDRFKDRIAEYKEENGKAFREKASRQGRDQLQVQQAYYQGGHNAGVDVLDGHIQDEPQSCCCCIQ